MRACCAVLWLLSASTLKTALCYFHDFTLPEDYDKQILPRGLPGKGPPLQVTVWNTIVDIISIHEYSNEVTYDMWLGYSWTEERMNISRKLEPGLRYPLNRYEADKLWTPDFFVAGLREFTTKHGSTNMRYMVLKDGALVLILRATVIVKCKFDFQLYPLDIQACRMEFMSPITREEELRFRWGTVGGRPLVTLGQPRDALQEMVLPQFHATLTVCPNEFTTQHVAGNVSTLRLWITFKRELKHHLLEIYVPAALFVVISWGSFLVKPEVVPGRMVLLVTNLLSLLTLFETNRTSSPPAKDIKCIDMWMLSCIVFVCFALLEYAAILYQTRGPWFKRSTDKLKPFVPPKVENREINELQENKNSCLQRLRTKIRPVSLATKRSLCNWQFDHSSWCLLDQISIFIFPATFFVYNILYWTTYLALRNKKSSSEECQ